MKIVFFGLAATIILLTSVSCNKTHSSSNSSNQDVTSQKQAIYKQYCNDLKDIREKVIEGESDAEKEKRKSIGCWKYLGLNVSIQLKTMVLSVNKKFDFSSDMYVFPSQDSYSSQEGFVIIYPASAAPSDSATPSDSAAPSASAAPSESSLNLNHHACHLFLTNQKDSTQLFKFETTEKREISSSFTEPKKFLEPIYSKFKGMYGSEYQFPDDILSLYNSSLPLHLINLAAFSKIGPMIFAPDDDGIVLNYLNDVAINESLIKNATFNESSPNKDSKKCNFIISRP